MKAYLLDAGVLLSKDHEEYTNYAVYDRAYGYYDEDQFYLLTKEEAIDQARAYVEMGVDNTYAVVSDTIVNKTDNIKEACVYDEDHDFTLENVVFSIAKINGIVVENFLKKE